MAPVPLTRFLRPPPVLDKREHGAPIANWEQSAPRNTPISHAIISEKVIKTLPRTIHSLLQATSCRRLRRSRGSYRKLGTECTSQHADSRKPLSQRE
ncbi:hypothetical protein CEXT_614661 [Caerostris extrusa]|uniref:Uncharacterized protein n=1 Tax=Caerostris extrusa TaxID=172846 RepID=A0AAV4PBK4_CAEEX|nr:hypothetical protein CEXT_614661 [Caerostris extrusa]